MTPRRIVKDPTWRIVVGDSVAALRNMSDDSVHCIVTSPPYWNLRDYGVEDQIGLEATPELYVERLVTVFAEARRVLRDDGTLWLNIGDSYAGSWGAQSRGGPPSCKSTLRGNGHVGGGPKIRSLAAAQIEAAPRRDSHTGSWVNQHPVLKPKDLVGIPWRLAFALQADGWFLRSDIIWHKPNPLPESVRDRPTKSHEYVFLLTKTARYSFDDRAIAEPATGRPSGNTKPNKGFTEDPTRFRCRAGLQDYAARETRRPRTVWTIATQPFKGAHFAVFPEDLARRCILAGCPSGGVVLDPFCGSGTAGVAALTTGRGFVGIDANPDYVEMARRRISACVV